MSIKIFIYLPQQFSKYDLMTLNTYCLILLCEVQCQADLIYDARSRESGNLCILEDLFFKEGRGDFLAFI